MASGSGRDPQQCSNCQNSASHVCNACKAMPNPVDGEPASTWYCGPECQKIHWTQHKVQCRATRSRQALYRAGAIAQHIFYLYMKHSFLWNPGRIDKIGTTWLIHDNAYTGGTSQVMPFPYEIVPDVHDQEALLTFQNCSTAVSGMHNVVADLLRGESQ